MSSYAIRDVKVVNQLERLEKDMLNMKNRQHIGGRTLATKITSSRLYASRTIYNFDGPPIGQGLYENLIEFVAESQLNPYGSLTIELFDMAGNRISTSATVTTGPMIRRLIMLPGNAPGDRTLRWDVDIAHVSGLNTTGTPFQVLFTVAATDTGVVTATDFEYPNL